MLQTNNNTVINIVEYNKNIIKSKSYSYDTKLYEILNYNKNFVCYDDYESSKYRSVILALPENKLLCYSSPKSMSFEAFTNKYPVINEQIMVNDIIEGTMINIFYDDRDGLWHISTKSAIGGNYWYFRNQYNNKEKSQKTFREMFLESLKVSNINDLTFLNKEYCYSFVLQHPDNHIVLHIDKPSSYLVAIYKIYKTDCNNNFEVKYISPMEFTNWDCFNNTEVKFPNSHDCECYEKLQEIYNSTYNDYTNVGVMITHTETGERTYIKNKSYEFVKELRGNNPNLLYQYICLLRVNKVSNYLSYFPQYKKLFSEFQDRYYKFIKSIYDAYVSYYIKKKKHICLSREMLYHINTLHHTIYLPSLECKYTIGAKKITNKVVSDYINNMDPMQIFHYLQM